MKLEWICHPGCGSSCHRLRPGVVLKRVNPLGTRLTCKVTVISAVEKKIMVRMISVTGEKHIGGLECLR